MLFNSFGYILLFLPAVLAVVVLAKRLSGPRAAQIAVLLASITFYAWFRWTNLFFLAASILANWFVAKKIAAAIDGHRKRWLQVGLVANIAYLCTFKYVNFLLGSLPFMHGHEHLIPDLEFPLGISFFTLAQVMYLVDGYEGIVTPGTLFDHATFVTFFPYVISGPIAKARRMRHQFAHFGGEPGKRTARIARGLFLFSLGLFKKVVFADAFGQLADYGYNTAHDRSSLEVLVFTATYALQLYFSGASKLRGISMPSISAVPMAMSL